MDSRSPLPPKCMQCGKTIVASEARAFFRGFYILALFAMLYFTREWYENEVHWILWAIALFWLLLGIAIGWYAIRKIYGPSCRCRKPQPPDWFRA